VNCVELNLPVDRELSKNPRQHVVIKQIKPNFLCIRCQTLWVTSGVGGVQQGYTKSASMVSWLDVPRYGTIVHNSGKV
jgi:hypothetical protein